LIGGCNVTDTAAALLKSALVVEVRDSSGAIPPQGTVVRFATVVKSDALPEVLLLNPQLPSNFDMIYDAQTDAAGRAGVIVRLGLSAGPARLTVSAASIGVQDTVRYTVLPGNVAGVRMSPSDTTLYTGRNFTFRGVAVDAHGNPRTDPVTYTGSAPGVSVSNAGLVSVSAIGRYTVTGAAGGASGSAGISVPPQGTIAADDELPGRGHEIVTVALDGSDFRSLTSVSVGGMSPQPRWIPGTNRIIYSTFAGMYQLLRVVDQDGTVTPFIASPPATMTHQAEPAPSPNAPVVDFSAFDTR